MKRAAAAKRVRNTENERRDHEGRKKEAGHCTFPSIPAWGLASGGGGVIRVAGKQSDKGQRSSRGKAWPEDQGPRREEAREL